MRNRLRASFVLVIAIVTGFFSVYYLAISAGRGESPVLVIDWGSQRATGGTGIRHNTNIASQFDSEEPTFTYFSGAEFGVYDDELMHVARKASIPEQVVARAEFGDILVRVFGFYGIDTESAEHVASRIAQAIHLVTTEVWPVEPTFVQVDLFVLVEGTVFSHGIKVEWNAREPLRLAVFAFGLEQFGTIPTHELAHVLSGRWKTGGNSPNADPAGLLSNVFGEISAELYANCAELLVAGELTRPRPSDIRFNVNDRRIESPPTADDVAFLLRVLRGGAGVEQRAQTGVTIGHVLMTVPVLNVFGSNDRISLSAQEGLDLLSLCRDVSADPFSLDQWLEARFAGVASESN